MKCLQYGHRLLKSWAKELSEKFTKLCIKMPWSFLNVSTTLQEREGNNLLLLKSSMVGVGVFFFLSDAFFQGRALFKYELRIKAGLKGQGFCYSVRNYKGKIFSTMPKKCGIRNRQNSDNLNFDLLNL